MQDRVGLKSGIKDKKGSKLLSIFWILFAVIMGCCIFIKIIVGDFYFSDLSGFIFPLIIIGSYMLNKKPKREYNDKKEE